LASFFFSRDDSSRNNGNHLIPTLASHLVHSFEEVTPFVEDRILKHWDLFTKSFQTQIRELLIMPLDSVKSNGRVATHPPRLIVIDGLDECQNADVQCELLRVISRAILQIPYPVRFFVTSRPEAHITNVFDHDRDLQAIKVHRYNLNDDPDEAMDIRKYVEKEFEEIRRPNERHLPHTWPDQGAVDSLVERSSGNFTYASTVMRYIRSQKHHPVDLQEVLHRFPSPRPNTRLDASKDQQDSHAIGGTGSGNRGAVGSSVGEHISHEGNSLNDHLQQSSNTGGDSCRRRSILSKVLAKKRSWPLAGMATRELSNCLSPETMSVLTHQVRMAKRRSSRPPVKAVKQLSKYFCLETISPSTLLPPTRIVFGTYPGRTALLAASRRGYDGIVKLLLSQNDVDVISKMKMVKQRSFQLPVMATRELLNCFSLEVTSTLIHKTMMVEQHSSRLVTEGHEAVVKVLLSRDDVAINTTATDSDLFGTYPGQTALLAASCRGYRNCQIASLP
jgi:hypothetical protein